jgi:hypothetical protein
MKEAPFGAFFLPGCREQISIIVQLATLSCQIYVISVMLPLLTDASWRLTNAIYEIH